jgi:ech hydrogenase subunit B
MEFWNYWWIKLIFIFIVTPIAIGILNGLDRIITARLQGRKGPPLLQPFYDVFKLFAKAPKYANAISILYLAAYLVFSIVTLGLLVFGQDYLLILFTATLTAAMFVLTGMSFKSPYSQIGSHRELIQLISYEPVLILAAFGIFGYTALIAGGDGAFSGGTFMISALYAEGIKLPMIVYLPLLFFALTIILTIKLRKSPFDFSTSHHGHQEIVKGITIELSGRYLAIAELAHWFETMFILGLIVIFFGPWWYWGILAAAVLYILEILLDNVTPRLTYSWMLKATWITGITVCVVNLLWIYLLPYFG